MRMNYTRNSGLSVRSACWASSNGIKSIQMLREDHAVFTLPVIAQSDAHAVDLVVGVKRLPGGSPAATVPSLTQPAGDQSRVFRSVRMTRAARESW